MLTSSIIGPQILKFERSPSLSSGPQRSLIPPFKISLGGSDYIYIYIYIYIQGVPLVEKELLTHLEHLTEFTRGFWWGTCCSVFRFLCGVLDHCYSVFSFMCMFCR